MRIKRQRKSGSNRRCKKEKKKRINREEWRRESVLGVEDLAILLNIIEIERKKDQYRCPQIDLKF